MWHSLDENGKIKIYDVEWPDGTVETNIPVAMLESVREGSHTEGKEHGVQEENTPVNERKYRGKMMKISKRQLRRIIKEEAARLIAEQPISGAQADQMQRDQDRPGVARANVRRAIPQGEKIWAAFASLIDDAMDQARGAEDFMELANDLRGYADDVEDSINENY